MTINWVVFWIFTTMLMALTAATVVGQMLRRQNELGVNPAVVEQFNLRVRAWWMLTAMLAVGYMFDSPKATVVLFGLLSVWALREFITITPTRMADHRTLSWVFFVFTPLQFYLVATDNYEAFSILIPVYAFLFIPARIALAGDFKRYLERCTTIQTGLMICVYCLSYAPAMLSLRPADSDPYLLLLFFFIITALSDAFHYVCEKLMGKHLIAPAISQNKTWEGFLGGLGCASLCGMALYWASPFPNQPALAAMAAAVISAMGYCGGLTMSAIKRDRGVKDYGTLLAGHSGLLDRIDSICFAAPVFYHLTRYLTVQA